MRAISSVWSEREAHNLLALGSSPRWPMKRDGIARLIRQAHNLETSGSNPLPAITGLVAQSGQSTRLLTSLSGVQIPSGP